LAICPVFSPKTSVLVWTLSLLQGDTVT
jgi:hypothetical protein